MKKMQNKRGQLTLFIIMAIVIVAVLIILFYPRLERLFVPSTPPIQLGDCIDKKLEEAIELVSKRGGSVNPVNSIMYNNNQIEYLCYTNEYYKTCANQQPLLKQHVEREILDYIKPEATKCVNDLREDLRNKGWQVSSGGEDISVSILPNNVKVVVSGFSVVKGDAGERYDKIESSYKSRLYDFVMLSSSILNWEARYGDSDPLSYMVYYPSLKIQKLKQQDGSKIYILTDLNTEESFTFASRSLSWPGGYGIGEKVRI